MCKKFYKPSTHIILDDVKRTWYTCLYQKSIWPIKWVTSTIRNLKITEEAITKQLSQIYDPDSIYPSNWWAYFQCSLFQTTNGGNVGMFIIFQVWDVSLLGILQEWENYVSWEEILENKFQNCILSEKFPLTIHVPQDLSDMSLHKVILLHNWNKVQKLNSKIGAKKKITCLLLNTMSFYLFRI